MKKCLLCKKSDEGVTEFDEETFSKCCRMLAFRREKNFAHGEIALPLGSQKEFGKHQQCYKKIIVLKAKFREDFDSFCKKLQNEAGPAKSNAIPQLHIAGCSGGDSDSQKENSTESAKMDDPSSTVHEDSIASSASTQIPIKAETPSKSKSTPSTSVQEGISLPKEPSTASSKKTKRQPCLICNVVRKSIGQQQICVSFAKSPESIKKIREAARICNDRALLSKLENRVEVPYHPTCLSNYRKKSNKTADEQRVKEPWHSTRELHKEAFASISITIQQDIIKKEKVLFLSDLFERYKALLLEFQQDKTSNDILEHVRINHLETKIADSFGDEVTIEQSFDRNEKKIVYKRDLSVSRLASEIAEMRKNEANKMDNVAYSLRNIITSMDSQKLPNENLLLDDVFQGECKIPEALLSFVKKVVQGPDVRRQDSENDMVRIRSICSDIISATTKGRVKQEYM